jgi:hypothetical protein
MCSPVYLQDFGCSINYIAVKFSQYSVWLHTGFLEFDPWQRSFPLASEAHLASCPTDTGDKTWPRHGSDHWPPSSAEVKNE